MSFRAREFVKGQESTPRVRRLAAEDHLVEKIGELLAAESRRLRAKGHKRLFKKVDKLLVGPRSTSRHVRAEIDRARIGECLRCGDFFVKLRPSNKFCCNEHFREHERWAKNRGRRTV